MTEEGRQWGQAWLLIGLLVACLAFPTRSRDGLLMLTLVHSFLAMAATGVVTGNFRIGVFQFFSALGLVIGVTIFFVQISFPPPCAVPLWLAIATGTANVFAGRRLSLLALIGQTLPLVALSIGVVVHFQIPMWSGVGTFLATLPCLFVGTLLARRLPA